MAIKQKTTKLRSRGKIRKTTKLARRQAKERRIQRIFAKADRKVAKYRKQERTAPHLIGGVYTETKKEAGHGHWMEWLTAKQFVSKSTANHYMAIYRTFSSPEEASLFSVEQQKLLTHKKVTNDMREVLIGRARECEQWTNEKFKVELTKLGSTSGQLGKTPREFHPKKEEVKPKSKHKRWVEYVEGLLSALEDALVDDRWKRQRKKKRIRKRYVRIWKRLEGIREHFKVPAAGNSSPDSSVYMRKKTMEGKRNASK